MYYKVITTETAKIPRAKENFTIFNEEVLNFKTLEEVKSMLKEKYSGVKRVKMPDGEGKHVGYIYHFRNSDMFYNSGEWIQEDWVEVKEVEEKNVRPSMFV
jgi:hypothetical protein